MLQFSRKTVERSRQYLARTRSQTRDQFIVTTCAGNPELFKASVDLENEVWDNLSFLDYTAAHHAHYDELLERFPDCRLCMMEVESGEMVATGMCVPLRVTGDTALPGDGWDWIVDTAAAQHGRGATMLGALSISVPEVHRSRGFARDMINAMRASAIMQGLGGVIAPVRPSAKCQHPLEAMDRYVAWKDDHGRIYDPWLRSHVAAGGQIQGVCATSMVVEQPICFWEPWVGSKIGQSGDLTVPGALAPLHINADAGTGRYVEPNVWVVHGV